MMEGGVNPKKMARSKRASSQRSKAKHSKHGHGGGHVGVVSRERSVTEDALPSNWERYGDESGSDEVLAPLAEGEVRPKSKGADYSELLSSDAPQLFDESPEMEGMTAMLLANGLGLWDWDSSYLEPASLSSQQQAAREASALLTMDLRLLGESMARLNMAQRLFLEDELFPEQQNHLDDEIETTESSARISDSEGAAAPMEDEHLHEPDDLSPNTGFSARSARVGEGLNSSALDSETSSFSTYSLDYQDGTETSRLGRAGAKSPPFNIGDPFSNSVPAVSSVWEYTTDRKEQKRMENKEKPLEVKKFEATAAEAELDDLLDMLDNEVASISLKKNNEINPPKSFASRNDSSSSSIQGASRPSNVRFQKSRVETRPGGVTAEPLLGSVPKLAGTPSESVKKVERDDPKPGTKATDVLLSQDDDFDSWLDSI